MLTNTFFARFILPVAYLCLLSTTTALAQFTNYAISPWYGGTDHYYGNTLITAPGTFNNSAALRFVASTLPGNTGPLYAWDLAPGATITSNYYDGVGVLSVNHGWTNIINNNTGGTFQGIVTGSGQAFALGLSAYSDNANTYVINNSGLMDGEVWNHDGTAAGVYAGGIVFATNNASGTWSATAPYYATGIYSSGGGAQNIINNGTITAIATGGMQNENGQTTTNQAYCAGINLFSFDPNAMSPIYVVNNGAITVSATGGNTNIAHCGAIWNDQNTVTWINNGTMTATMTGNSGDASGIYFGANNADVTFINTGTIFNAGGQGSQGGEGIWMESDGTNGDMYFYNSGTIASGEPFAAAIANYPQGPGPYGTAYATNTGTISGGWLGFGWNGNLNFYDSGDILTALAWIGSSITLGSNTYYGNINVTISGLPTIQPNLAAGVNGSNTLVLNLAGTLQSVNGSAASGTNLSAFNLGSLGSGNIVVSGKTYSWSNFTNVFGIIIPPVPPAAGPTNLTATAISSTQASLTWKAVAGATNYNVKRATTGCGPYTTIASGVAATNYTDNTAYSSVEYYYVVSAVVTGSETANSSEVTLRHPKLAGTLIGTAGSQGNSGNTITNVFDNNLNNYFDGPDADGDWVGLDLGAGVSNIITQLSYCPRTGFASRMVGGIFQGANQANFSDAVTLFTITNLPVQGFLTPVSVTNATAFRYVRYLSPNKGFCNVSELRFYSYQTVTPPPAPNSVSASLVSNSQINITWNAVTNAASYDLKRATAFGGPFTTIASGTTATNFADAGLAGGTVYYYLVSTVNPNGESLNSAIATAATPSPTYGNLLHCYHFSETNGTTITDSIGGPVWNGILPAGGTLSNGWLTLAPAASQYASLPSGIMSSLTNITLMAWVKLNSTPAWSRVFDFGNDTTTYMFITPQIGGTMRFAITTNSSGGEQQINGNAAVTTNVWHQIAITLNTNRGILYLDGTAIGTNADMTLTPASLGVTTNNYLGKSQWADPYMDGAFDEFRIYGASLSAAEIAAAAALGANQQLSTNNPTAGVILSANNLTLTWPLASAGYSAQARTNLAVGNWVNITSSVPQIVGNQWQITLPVYSTNHSTFYRLAK